MPRLTFTVTLALDGAQHVPSVEHDMHEALRDAFPDATVKVERQSAEAIDAASRKGL